MTTTTRVVSHMRYLTLAQQRVNWRFLSSRPRQNVPARGVLLRNIKCPTRNALDQRMWALFGLFARYDVGCQTLMAAKEFLVCVFAVHAIKFRVPTDPRPMCTANVWSRNALTQLRCRGSIRSVPNGRYSSHIRPICAGQSGRANTHTNTHTRNTKRVIVNTEHRTRIV